MSNFVRDLLNLYPTKSDFKPLSATPGLLSNQAWQASDANSIEGAAYDLRGEILAGAIHGLKNGDGDAASPASGFAFGRMSDGRAQVSENGQPFKSVLRGKDVWDIRDFATNVMNGNATQDTAALVAACAKISSDSNSANARPGTILFPRGNLLLTTPLTIYGSAGSASSLIGTNGRSRGPDGTCITWAGGNSMSPMLHLLGMNASLIQGIAFNGFQDATHLARFCVWAETNQRNGGAGSSGLKFQDCWFTGYGNLGAGLVIGDEVRTTLTVNTLVGSFIVGEQVLNSQDGIATVLIWDGATQLKIGQLMGNSFTTATVTLLGLTSGATATIASSSIDGAYLGNLQCSELVVDHCGFQGTEISDQTDKRAGWAGIATFGVGNNKNYTVINPVIDGMRYGIDTGIGGSGFFHVEGASGSTIGHAGKGFFARFGGGQVTWDGGDFENGGTSCKGGVFYLAAGGSMTVNAGEFFGYPPTDQYMIKNAGILNMFGSHLGADTGNAQIQTDPAIGTLGLYGVGWRENFAGYLPIFDGSNNPLGLNGSADYARGATSNVIAENCLSNITGNAVILPDIYGRPISPLRNQLWDNGINAAVVVNRRGALSASCEVRTFDFNLVKSAGGTVEFADTPAKAVIRGVLIDVTTPFKGGALTAVVCRIGNDGSDNAYLADQDVWTAAGQFQSFTPVVAPWAGGTLKAKFSPTTAAISALTQGSVTIYVFYEKL